MNTNRAHGVRWGVRSAGVGAAAVVAVGLLSTGAAGADTFVPLPGGELSKTLSDGTAVHVWLDGESANIDPSMGATAVHRTARVSGNAHVELSGTTTAVGGSLYPGYTVGCEVDISGVGADGGPGANMDWSDGENAKPDAGGNVGGNLTLAPGQAKSFYVLDLEENDASGRDVHKSRNKFQGDSGSVAWSDEAIGLTGCGGQAQARAFVSVEVETDDVISWVTLWGEPFSLG
ncbi:MspA family porin [Nocardia africana]|uniref:MspA n=1 Tax=Nocardia africana TaxID=134964 RepID=A0A378X665_9NOCA|nr:MspA family porin [Nocardia africana]MCC3317299.1 MspA family porin [Nocardia africana]SUA48033.1 MspA [Nocardia africana]